MAKKSAAKPKPTTSRRDTVPPVNVLKLMDILGGTKTSAQLGVSTTLLYNAKNKNEITRSVELAAAHALSNLGREDQPAPATAHETFSPRGPSNRSGDAVFLVTISADKAAVFQRMAEALGAVMVPA